MIVLELKAFFFKTLFLWTVAFDCLHIANFRDLHDLLSLSRYVSYIFPMYMCSAFSQLKKIKNEHKISQENFYGD